MFRLKRLYVENYKLFTQKEVDFSKTLLAVFDGPNGYGKTSIFDAIELLITGKIGRVMDCESLDGKQAYHTVFFAKDNGKDVILKAEFENVKSKSVVVLGARIRSCDIEGKLANPKNIFDNIEYYSLPDYNIDAKDWNSYSTTPDTLLVLRNRIFGEQNIEHFNLFLYIRQEDRLSYFKQAEKSRASTIEKLLGVEKEIQDHKNIQEKRKSIEKLAKRIETEIKDKERRIVERVGDFDSKTDYEPLINGEPFWDKESVFGGELGQDKLLAQYNTELDKIENYVKYAEFHSSFFAHESFMGVNENERNAAIQALILLHKEPFSFDEIDISFQNLKFLKESKEKINEQDYSSLNLSRMYTIIGNPTDDSIENEINTLVYISKSQSELQKAINNVIKVRDNLHRINTEVSDDGLCPYCGYDWKDHEELEKQFATTKDTLQQLLSEEGDRYSRQLEIVKGKIEINIIGGLNSKIEEFSKRDIIKVYGNFESKADFISAIEKVKPLFDISSASLVDNMDVMDVYECSKQIAEICTGIGRSIPSEYLYANQKYAFSYVRDNYIREFDISRLKKERIDKKRRYLQEQFYKSFDIIKEEIQNLNDKLDKTKKIITQLTAYENAVKKAIEKYKKQIIDEIEIPFFIYSSRLLQSYQGGQGVFMKNTGESIRFTAPGNEHDVLYTMSSGQLSAVLLSFSLALNKIYSRQGIKTILIDDPIQCMDDINMISFVELLRSEFSGYQIILSTHEANFSDYVRYKFKKYGLETQAITLKDA